MFLAHFTSEFELLVNYKIVALYDKFPDQLKLSWLDICTTSYAENTN